MNKIRLSVLTFFLSFLALSALGEKAYSPGVQSDIPREVFFGDLHLHSRASADSYAMGNRSLTARDAYRFAAGEEIEASSGLPAQLRRPLDFLAVTDHAEFMGVLNALTEKDPELMSSPLGKRWGAASTDEFLTSFVESLSNPDPVRDDVPDDLEWRIWRQLTSVAEEHYRPGAFTTFSAYEWTADSEGNNLHRCVIYRDNSELTSSVLPFSSFLGSDPEQLWAALHRYEEQTGGRVISIPHNGNLSNGIMWDTHRLGGQAIDAEYARLRMRWEPVAEVTQVKGDSETHPLLSPSDEFAAFERWDRYNIMNTAETKPEMLPGSYARSALKRGLAFADSTGINPYQFGMIGSTDSHTSLSTANEDNFFGKFANSEPGVRSPESMMAGMKNADWELGASGLAAIWARENTREALFDALERKEIYATTGPRIKLRFFASWDFVEQDLQTLDLPQVAYAKGVPMGGDLPERSTEDAEGAPSFIVLALKDPDGVNLSRLQIIKGWLDASGQVQEQIYDVAGQQGGRAQLFGAAYLSAYWRDPGFDANQHAFYYARVVEIERPRWTIYDQRHFDTPQSSDAPAVVQDRAYSSPIWYAP